MEQLKPDEYRCDHCGGVFTKGWTEEEALADFHNTFPNTEPAEGDAVFCEDCYQKFMQWYNSGGREIVQREMGRQP